MAKAARVKLGETLYNARYRAGLTQQEVADGMGYSSPQFVSNWERGETMPPIGSLRRLARLLKVSPRKLVDYVFECRIEELEAEWKEVARKAAA